MRTWGQARIVRAMRYFSPGDAGTGRRLPRRAGCGVLPLRISCISLGKSRASGAVSPNPASKLNRRADVGPGAGVELPPIPASKLNRRADLLGPRAGELPGDRDAITLLLKAARSARAGRMASSPGFRAPNLDHQISLSSKLVVRAQW